MYNNFSKNRPFLSRSKLEYPVNPPVLFALVALRKAVTLCTPLSVVVPHFRRLPYRCCFPLPSFSRRRFPHLVLEDFFIPFMAVVYDLVTICLIYLRAQFDLIAHLCRSLSANVRAFEKWVKSSRRKVISGFECHVFPRHMVAQILHLT